MPATFAHAVASGDPTTEAVVIWTRISDVTGEADVGWKLARDERLTDVVASGAAIASPDSDHTVHVDVTGLEPDTTYFYGFTAAGERSPTGRTKTLPGPHADHLRFAMCSCAKFNAGFFNAYARIAEAGNLDFLLHLGDYIYEASNTPPKNQTPGADIGRPFDPLGECRTLEEYRTRYAQYRGDPDVQAMHLALPLIATLDDHELADGAWREGADNHRPDEHGPWADRRAAAFQARWEWLPARPSDPADTTRVFREVRIGKLVDLFLTDIRSRRDQPALEPEMSRPERTMLGPEQRDWLFNALESSDAAWRLVVSPSILTRTWADDGVGEELHAALLKLKLIDEDGTGPDEDQWDGYPAERAELIDRMGAQDDVIVLSGDIHMSNLAEVRTGEGEVAAIEITTPSLTSQNLDEKLGVDQRADAVQRAERAFVDRFEHVHWCEMASHGYVVVDVDPTRVRAEWHLVDGVLERTTGERIGAACEVPRGSTEVALSA